MITQETTHRDLGTPEHQLARYPDGASEISLLLAALDARAALQFAKEDATLEAQDVLTQADEALVMG